MKISIIVTVVIIVVAGAVYLQSAQNDNGDITNTTNSASNNTNQVLVNEQTNSEVETPEIKKSMAYSRVNITQYSSTYKFSAEIPDTWQVEYVSATDALNIFDPQAAESNSLEQSQFFIRFFEANTFLTLSTVTILNQTNTTVQNRPAIHYAIEKKSGVANFPNQPLWRSQQHELTDIRLTDENPSLFYVMAYAPDVPQAIVDKFFDSLEF